MGEQWPAVLAVGALWQLLAPIFRKKIPQGFSIEFGRYLEKNNCPIMQFLTYGYNVTIVISNTDISKYPLIYIEYRLEIFPIFVTFQFLLPQTSAVNTGGKCLAVLQQIHVQTNNHSVFFMFSQTDMKFAWAPPCCIWLKSVFRRNHVTSRIHFNTFLYKMA